MAALEVAKSIYQRPRRCELPALVDLQVCEQSEPGEQGLGRITSSSISLSFFFKGIKVALDFVSPENAGECIRLSEEFRLLPEDHRAKEDALEVKKMALYAIRQAEKDMEDSGDEQKFKTQVREPLMVADLPLSPLSLQSSPVEDQAHRSLPSEPRCLSPLQTQQLLPLLSLQLSTTLTFESCSVEALTRHSLTSLRLMPSPMEAQPHQLSSSLNVQASRIEAQNHRSSSLQSFQPWLLESDTCQPLPLQSFGLSPIEIVTSRPSIMKILQSSLIEAEASHSVPSQIHNPVSFSSLQQSPVKAPTNHLWTSQTHHSSSLSSLQPSHTQPSSSSQSLQPCLVESYACQPSSFLKLQSFPNETLGCLPFLLKSLQSSEIETCPSSPRQLQMANGEEIMDAAVAATAAGTSFQHSDHGCKLLWRPATSLDNSMVKGVVYEKIGMATFVSERRKRNHLMAHVTSGKDDRPPTKSSSIGKELILRPKKNENICLVTNPRCRDDNLYVAKVTMFGFRRRLMQIGVGPRTFDQGLCGHACSPLSTGKLRALHSAVVKENELCGGNFRINYDPELFKDCFNLPLNMFHKAHYSFSNGTSDSICAVIKFMLKGEADRVRQAQKLRHASILGVIEVFQVECTHKLPAYLDKILEEENSKLLKDGESCGSSVFYVALLEPFLCTLDSYCGDMQHRELLCTYYTERGNRSPVFLSCRGQDLHRNVLEGLHCLHTSSILMGNFANQCFVCSPLSGTTFNVKILPGAETHHNVKDIDLLMSHFEMMLFNPLGLNLTEFHSVFTIPKSNFLTAGDLAEMFKRLLFMDVYSRCQLWCETNDHVQRFARGNPRTARNYMFQRMGNSIKTENWRPLIDATLFYWMTQPLKMTQPLQYPYYDMMSHACYMRMGRNCFCHQCQIARRIFPAPNVLGETNSTAMMYLYKVRPYFVDWLFDIQCKFNSPLR